MRLLRYLPRFQKAHGELDVLAQREGWSRGQIEDLQLQRLNTVWKHATHHVDYYRHLAAERQLPERFASVDEFKSHVPVLPKSAVRQESRRFLSEAAERGSWQRTGGSTGSPMGVFWGKDAYLETLRARYRMAAMWGVDILDRQVYLWGHSGSFAPGLAGLAAKYRRPLEDWLRSRLRLSAYRMGKQDLMAYVRKIQAFRPASIYGYSTAIYLLAREAAEADFQCDSLKLAIMSGEPAYPHFIDEVRRAFAIPAVAEYGATECGVIAGHWPDGTLRVREDVALVETLPRSDGLFDIVVTVLNNPSFPLIRYAIEDVSETLLESPENGFSILGNIGGRSNDLVVGRSGRFVHSIGIKHVFEHLSGVRRFQAHQQADGRLLVSLETNEDSGSIDTRDAERRLQELLEGYPATVQTVDRIPSTLAGKHRWIISDLATGQSEANAAQGDTTVTAV
jgi:phenylacetate-CoA ligase